MWARTLCGALRIGLELDLIFARIYGRLPTLYRLQLYRIYRETTRIVKAKTPDANRYL